MNRRLYYQIPDRARALSIVNELVSEGIATDNMHTPGGQDKQLDGLPTPSKRQYNDTTGHLEGFLGMPTANLDE